ncbi:MAG: hypothetical protein ACI9UT_002227 [Flavobacteriales bacterium]
MMTKKYPCYCHPSRYRFFSQHKFSSTLNKMRIEFL